MASVPPGPSPKLTSDTLWIDQARGAAALAVVLLHVSAGVVRETQDIASFAWWVGNIVDSAMRWCVPVFVMISGALLLDRDERADSISTFYSRRAARLCLPIVFWSCLFLVWNAAKDHLKFGWVAYDALAGMLLSGRPHYHLWYVYMLLGLYLFIPFVRVLLHQLDLTKTMLLCSSIFALSFISTLHDHATGANRGVFLLWFLPYLSYLIAGRLIRRWNLPINKPRWRVVLLVSVALTAIGCYLAAVGIELKSGLYFYDYFSVTVIPMSMAMFFLLREAAPIRVLAALAPYSLGVYLVHPLFIEGLSYLGFAESHFNPLWAIPVKALVVLLLSLCAVGVIRRIPILRRVV